MVRFSGVVSGVLALLLWIGVGVANADECTQALSGGTLISHDVGLICDSFGAGSLVLDNATYLSALDVSGNVHDILGVDASGNTELVAPTGETLELVIGSTNELTLTATTSTFVGSDVTIADGNLLFNSSTDASRTLTYGDGGTTASQTFDIAASTSDGDDDYITRISGGGGAAGNRGGYLILQGAEVGGANSGDVTLGSTDFVNIVGGTSDGKIVSFRGGTNISSFTGTVKFSQAESGTGSTNASVNIKKNCVTDDTDSGAGTQTLTGVIPAGVDSLGVTCFVNTILAGTSLTTWSLGDGTDADLYGTALALAQGTTVTHADYTADPSTQAWSSSAGDLTMTAAAGQFDSGNITCCSFYIDHDAATG